MHDPRPAVDPKAAWAGTPSTQANQTLRRSKTGKIVQHGHKPTKKKGALTANAQEADGIWVEFDEQGRQRCVSRTEAGSQCRMWGVDGRDRCAFHAPPKMPMSEVRERRFVRYRTGRLAEKTARFMADPEYKDLTEEIAHLRAQIEAMIETAENEADDAAVAERMDFLRKMVLTASTIEQNLRANLNIGQAQAFAEQLLAIVLDECQDPAVRARVAKRIDGLIVTGADAVLKQALPAPEDVD